MHLGGLSDIQARALYWGFKASGRCSVSRMLPPDIRLGHFEQNNPRDSVPAEWRCRASRKTRTLVAYASNACAPLLRYWRIMCRTIDMARVSPRAFRAWPPAWPTPSGSLGWRRLQCSRVSPQDRFCEAVRKDLRMPSSAGRASPDNARQTRCPQRFHGDRLAGAVPRRYGGDRRPPVSGEPCAARARELCAEFDCELGVVWARLGTWPGRCSVPLFCLGRFR